MDFDPLLLASGGDDKLIQIITGLVKLHENQNDVLQQCMNAIVALDRRLKILEQLAAPYQTQKALEGTTAAVVLKDWKPK